MTNSNRYLIVDTETTGLPERPAQFGTWYPPSETDRYNTARMVQIAWAFVDNTFEPLDRYCVLVKPRLIKSESEPKIEMYDFVHDGEASRINGITQNELLTSGRDIDAVLDQLLFVLQRGVTHFVAHNAGFDLNIIRSECHRVQRTDVLEALNALNVVCTMNETRSVVNLPGRTGVGNKLPRLIELYQHCFGAEAMFSNQHRADSDVEALRKCLVVLRARQLEGTTPQTSVQK